MAHVYIPEFIEPRAAAVNVEECMKLLKGGHYANSFAGEKVPWETTPASILSHPDVKLTLMVQVNMLMKDLDDIPEVHMEMPHTMRMIGKLAKTGTGSLAFNNFEAYTFTLRFVEITDLEPSKRDRSMGLKELRKSSKPLLPANWVGYI